MFRASRSNLTGSGLRRTLAEPLGFLFTDYPVHDIESSGYLVRLNDKRREKPEGVTAGIGEDQPFGLGGKELGVDVDARLKREHQTEPSDLFDKLVFASDLGKSCLHRVPQALGPGWEVVLDYEVQSR